MTVQRGRCRSEINITPYIDILLVLLIIFMVIQPTTQYDLEARTPSLPQTDAPSAPATSIVIEIDAGGGVAINGRAARLRDLGEDLFEILSRRADKRLFVMASPDLPFGDIVRVIDVAKGAGAGDVGLLSRSGS